MCILINPLRERLRHVSFRQYMIHTVKAYPKLNHWGFENESKHDCREDEVWVFSDRKNVERWVAQLPKYTNEGLRLSPDSELVL